ncbi:dihydrodipicolinate synthase family protein [Anaerocolumna sp. MB42-C2]|uniref:dihydrodipicolinate synthase family protein n=1 Tax=Anaerocolumna sp. MB42-C2 TaxID=3070997 RepID=UPI0027E0E306|nr:dihydrodipicolinate synthase family protein [Anaerocolumna sp. MB42-C2]WMJ86189.1 dihydrodipicolinate synthase family protein [Anaerocolumna sp. MB42-C2]
MAFRPYGIIPPIITPTTKEGKINEKVLRQLVNKFIEEGVHGLFPLGTTGEFYAFTEDEMKRILFTVVEETGGRVPVYAGANHITTRGVIEYLKVAKEAKVDAVSVLTPMFISQTQDELYQYYKSIAESTDLPIIIYNNTPKTNINVTPETIARLADIDNIVGVKDSTGDMTNTEEYIRLTRDKENFGVLVGRDTLIYAGLCYGAVGAIASCANIAPKLTASIYNKYTEGDLVGALEAQYDLAPLRILCNMGTFPAVIKEGLVLQGFDVGKCLDPIQELKPEEKQKLKDQLKILNLI